MCDNAEVLKQNKKSAEYVTRKQEERVNQNRYTVHRLSAQDYYEQARQLSDKRHNYLRNHVRSAIVDKLGGERYKAFDDLKIKKAGEEAEENITLHHAAGSKYALDGEDVVEFNIAGSGFRYPRMEHKDMTAWENTDEFREEDIKISWYNRVRPFTWLPKVKTKKRIEQINANRTEMNRKMEDIYGERADKEIKGKKLGHLRKKEGTNDRDATKTRFYLRGPNAVDIGKYSEDHLEEYILELGKSSLAPRLDELERLDNNAIKDQKSLHVMVQGHSRGGVASVLGAMRIKRWIADNHPRLLSKVKFDLIQYDPVAGGIENYGNNAKVDHNPADEKLAKKDPRYMSLGEEANTTVVYSMHTDHKALFTPQNVQNAKRIILTMADHGVNLNQTDKSQKNGTKRITYLAEKDGKVEAFRSSGLGELNEGVYICDDQNNLIRLKSLEEYDALAKSLLKGAHLQGSRHEVVRDSVKSWFAGHGEQITEEDFKQDKKQYSVKKEKKSKEQPFVGRPKTIEELEAESYIPPKEMEAALKEKKKLDTMPQDTPEQKAAYKKKNKKYITAKRSGIKAYINRLYKQKGGYIDRGRKDYLDMIADLSYYMEKEKAGLPDPDRPKKIAKLTEKIKINPNYYSADKFMPGYLKSALYAGTDEKIKEIVYPQAEQPAQKEKAKKAEAKQEEAKQEEAKQAEIKQEEIKQGEPVQAEKEEKKQEEVKQEEIKQEEAKQAENKDGTRWDSKVTELFTDLCGGIKDEYYDRKKGTVVSDEIWSRIRVMDNEDSVTYRQFRSAVRHVKILVKKLQLDADEEFRPDARDLMQAMARLSETAKAFYDTHRGHQYSDKGKDRRMACDMVRQLTRDFYDKMDAAMGGKGYENIVTKKKPEEKGVDHRIVSADKMKELVSVYGKWKKHFALQEGLERSKIRDRAKLFEPYERYIEMYKDTHRTKEWSKEIEEVIRDAASYRVQNRVFETYEKEKNGIDDPVLALAKKHADKITGRQKPEERFDSNEIDAKLSDKQLKALDSIDRWFLRNYNNGGTVGTLINVKNHHGEIVSELFSKTKRERLFIYYLIETRQRKNPGVFDVFSSQSYIPDLERFKDRMLASKFKVMSRIMGGYTYMGKVTESMQVNRDYRSLIKDVAKLDRGVKEVKGKELEELKKKKEEYRTYALARTSQSTKAFRDEAIRVGELGKKATKKDRDSLNEKQQAFLKDLEELIRSDEAVGEAIRYGETLGEVEKKDTGERSLKENDKYYNVKNTNRVDLADNTDTYSKVGSGLSQNVHMIVNGGIFYGATVKQGLNIAKGKEYNPTYWKLKENNYMNPGTYGSTITAATISSLGSLLGACYGVYNLVTNWDNMHGFDRAASVAGILQSAGTYMNTVMTTVDTAKELADGLEATTSTLTKTVGISVAALKAGTDLYTTVSGHYDCKNSKKAKTILNDKIYDRYVKQLKSQSEVEDKSKKNAGPEAEEQKAKAEREYKNARYERNMIKLSGKMSGRKRTFGGVQTVASFMTVVGLTVPVAGTVLSGVGSLISSLTGILSGVKLTDIRTSMFDEYFQFDSFIKDVLEDMGKRGQTVNDPEEFRERMRRVLAASAGYADLISACDQITKEYADQICKGLFGDDEERVEGEYREAYIEIVKSFGLPYDEAKRIPGPELLARRMNGK